MPSRSAAQEFYQQKRFALVGVSRDSKQLANALFRKLKEKGYEVYPVNPNAEQVEGVRCYASVKDLPVAVDGAIIMLPVDLSVSVIQDCQTAGVPRVWLHPAQPETIALAHGAGVKVVEGICPFMFLGGFPHNIHRFFTHMEA